jgi:hypothetical protein
MNKSAWIFLFLTGCGIGDLYKMVSHRQFKVGDCLAVGRYSEKWDIPTNLVMEIGKRQYLTAVIYEGTITSVRDEIKFGHLWEDFYHKVPCGDL